MFACLIVFVIIGIIIAAVVVPKLSKPTGYSLPDLGGWTTIPDSPNIPGSFIPSSTNNFCAHGKFESVMTIVLNGADSDAVMSEFFFGTEIPGAGYLLANVSAVGSGGQVNHVAMISGNTYGIVDENPVELNGNTVVDLLELKGLTWGAYLEDYPGGCSAIKESPDGSYQRSRNPFISFKSISSNSKRCSNIKPASSFQTDLDADNLPNYMYYVPGAASIGTRQEGSVASASYWLKGFLQNTLTNPSFAYTLFFITFEQPVSSDANVYGILLNTGILGPSIVDNKPYTLISWLKTIEWAFGLGDLSQKDATENPFPLQEQPNGSCGIMATLTATF
ncbi:hypothetical protein HDU97_010026 [Phlyctochytrium planicorne]|nr:hypothetical protein HDU97_010026 [Phlyctochytrium planicorne]